MRSLEKVRALALRLSSADIDEPMSRDLLYVAGTSCGMIADLVAYVAAQQERLEGLEDMQGQILRKIPLPGEVALGTKDRSEAAQGLVGLISNAPYVMNWAEANQRDFFEMLQSRLSKVQALFPEFVDHVPGICDRCGERYNADDANYHDDGTIICEGCECEEHDERDTLAQRQAAQMFLACWTRYLAQPNQEQWERLAKAFAWVQGVYEEFRASKKPEQT